MFHWICPECGREIPPSVKECPACDPSAPDARIGPAISVGACAPPAHASAPLETSLPVVRESEEETRAEAAHAPTPIENPDPAPEPDPIAAASAHEALTGQASIVQEETPQVPAEGASLQERSVVQASEEELRMPLAHA